MKKFYTLLTIGTLIAGSASAQWCTPTASPTTMNSYASSSPVITNVTFNTINRTTASSNKELYIYTGVGTSVARSSNVPFSMTYTIDPGICPQMNIRIWIDWNLDGDFIDAGETALSINGTTASNFNGTISVPATATIGTTRMRVALKMAEACGHTTPDPCVPSETVGWHGEIEDYDLTVTSAVGINDISSIGGFKVYPNPSNGIFNLDLPLDLMESQINIYNITGSLVYQTTEYQKPLNLTKFDKGVYFIKLTNNYTSFIERLIIK